MDKANQKNKRFLAVGVILVVLVSFIFLLWSKGWVIPNAISANRYDVKGVDVSSYQGEINWNVLSKQDIQFAFIKATEGSSFQDPLFKQNWEQANRKSMRIGAYHFFSYDSKGETQAANFIKAVSLRNNDLPPVIDVEFYGDKKQNLPSQKHVYKELSSMIKRLESHYDKRVILYTTPKAYDLYIKNRYPGCDIWIRDVVKKPTLEEQKEWTFWQYTDKGRLSGYKGKETFIDLNVFNGNKAEFERY
ncbi:glycoside hydrolase family 25 protein [Priestia megaterium]|uniref:glycoside hydrolase family 25 protein n=1 Tax=Priestia megaterium TaxID=1404 RepID=UPI00355C9292